MASYPATITSDQRLLLRAALDEPDRALRCFSDWWDHVTLEEIGGTEYRLLPLVYHNIGRLIGDTEASARVKGVAKHVWLTNQLNASLAAVVLDRLNAARIPAVLLKGSAMMVAVSENNMRLMGDCDILIAADQAPQVLTALQELGLRTPQDVSRFTATDYRILHGLTMVREGKQKALIDIHWRPFRNVGADELTSEFFDRSTPCVFSNQPALRPSFPHMLLHVIVHGTEWAAVPRYDWFADATLILRKAGSSFDWDLLAETAARYRLGSIVHRGLRELARTFDEPIPPKALKLLSRGSFLDRAEAKWRYSSPERMSPARRAVMTVQALRRQNRQLAGRPAWSTLPEIWRSFFGPPPRSLMRPDMAADAEDHVIYLRGWYEPEQGGRWTNGPLAVLAIQRPSGRSGDFLRIAGRPMQATPGEPQVIDIYCGWRRLGRLSWDLSAGQTRVETMRLPPPLRQRSVLTLQFRIAKPTSPADTGQSEDIRKLGLFLESIRTLLPWRDAGATPLRFHRDSGDLDVLWSGWSQPEAEGCWTDAHQASLRWTAPRQTPAGASLVIEGVAFASEDEALKGSISINGQHAGDFVRPRGAATLSVPMAIPADDRDIDVRLTFQNPKSPDELGLSSDRRKLAWFLTSIRIEVRDPTEGPSA